MTLRRDVENCAFVKQTAKTFSQSKNELLITYNK